MNILYLFKLIPFIIELLSAVLFLCSVNTRQQSDEKLNGGQCDEWVLVLFSNIWTSL